MTVHDLHDALNLLPGDLITATDRLRAASKTTVVHWRRWISLAAVLALVVGTSMVFTRELMPSMGSDKKESAAAQAPAAAAPMAPAPMEQEIAADEAKPDAPAAEAPAEDAKGSSAVTGSENGVKEEFCIDHSHRFAEEGDPGADVPSGYCGNLMVTVTLAGEPHSLTGADALALTEILTELEYDPNTVCRCMAEFTVDTELLAGIHVNLTQGFARCEKGQATLTEQQAQIIQEIIDSLQ